MQLEDELLVFLQQPLMCIVAATDGTGRPSVGRGIGVHVLEDRNTLDVIFSGWQWPRLESAVHQTGRLAATFVSPSDYVTFQLKGAAAMQETQASHLEMAQRFIITATDELAALGVPRNIIAPWLTAREARVARLTVNEIYIQTPGPTAGMRTGARP